MVKAFKKFLKKTIRFPQGLLSVPLQKKKLDAKERVKGIRGPRGYASTRKAAKRQLYERLSPSFLTRLEVKKQEIYRDFVRSFRFSEHEKKWEWSIREILEGRRGENGASADYSQYPYRLDGQRWFRAQYVPEVYREAQEKKFKFEENEEALQKTKAYMVPSLVLNFYKQKEPFLSRLAWADYDRRANDLYEKHFYDHSLSFNEYNEAMQKLDLWYDEVRDGLWNLHFDLPLGFDIMSLNK